MKYIDEYRSQELVRSLTERLHAKISRPVRIMEVCGTHTIAIFRHGLRRMLPEQIELISGPGCPVCVTPSGVIDAFIDLAGRKDILITTFGDMIRVPGTTGSLAQARAAGADVHIVYSPMDALELARHNPHKLVVFLAVGFETTTPTIGATVLEAARRNMDNFCIFPAAKVIPPPLRALMEDPKLQVDGLLCPGHVSVILGSRAYGFLVEEFGLACAVAGFEPTDILLAITSLVNQVQSGHPTVDNCYGRAVAPEGNRKAREIVDQVFKPVDSDWRGLGPIPASGLGLREEYGAFDITRRLEIPIVNSGEPPGCRCGEILKGICQPPDCPLFGRACSPASPIGPCMVSTEGTCAAWHRYGTLD
ncbi:hydrogenase expression/formation protein [Desulfolithobacter dissulfuricans]|uniref:Hydrogenase expression/formation protein n=1 Tax=Desulfolithobacter dissulfuricans TaxID=2795293 RepID=A0A915U2R4_9BACT|nr:hydrogenase formation protein HypD [Desulfolithobacter dissulfuricans]BCO09452.1 hydrogenase expression/formation protein [Desulfolithobacter dissulfuricans]